MKIKTKILVPFLAMSLLIALIGAFAVNRQQVTAIEAATREAENVAHVLGISFVSDQNQLEASAQELVSRLSVNERRDVVLVDTHKRVLADAVPASIGEIFDDGHDGAVSATLSDGKARTFAEINEEHPTGLKQVVAPVQSKSGQILGAVILEYGPLYDELMQPTRSSIRQLIAIVVISVLISIFVAIYLGSAIGKPLEQLTEAATGFASGRTDLRMPPPRKDEMGKLASAFSNMVQKRQHAEDQIRRIHNELEARVVERTAELAKTNELLLAENAERKRAEAVSIRLAAIVESSDEIIIGKDLVGIVTSWNKGAERIFGYTASEMVGSAITQLLPADRQYEEHEILEKIKRGKSVEQFETVRQSRDGRTVNVSITASPIKNAIGQVVGIAEVARDITDRKQAEVTLEKAHQELIKVSRQAGMAEVATSVLHNVGNVLNSVNVASTCVAEGLRKSKAANLGKIVAMLREREADLGDFVTTDPKGRQIPAYLAELSEHLNASQASALKELAGLQKNIEHIKDVVAMQQSYAKVSGVTEVLNVTDLVEDAIRMNLSGLIRHEVSICKEFETMPLITVEKHKVLQILVNLIHNAKQACEMALAQKRLTVRITNEEGRVKIAVSDNGCGIAPENLSRIFNHGFTTKKEGHGFGLHSGALAAKEMGGILHVHSKGAGQGATFTLELPLTPLSKSNL